MSTSPNRQNAHWVFLFLSALYPEFGLPMWLTFIDIASFSTLGGAKEPLPARRVLLADSPWQKNGFRASSVFSFLFIFVLSCFVCLLLIRLVFEEILHVLARNTSI